MKPVFSNTFNVTCNKTRTEVSLSFAHVYTDHSFSMKNGTLTDVSAQLVDEVASVLITRDGAVALAKLFNKMMDDWGIDISE